MTYLAIAMFASLIAFGERYMGWYDPHSQVQIGLSLAFILGIVCGYRSGK